MFFSKKKEEPAKAEAASATATASAVDPAVAEPPKPVVKKKEKRNMEYEVIISKNTSINGNININGCTRIDGNIEGTLAVDNDLYIGEPGNIKAMVYAKNATVSGTVIGNMAVSGRLELTSNAKLFGDIKCGMLIIAEGAQFRGKCSGIESEPAADQTAYAEVAAE